MFGKSFRYATGFSVDQPSILPVRRVAVQKQHCCGATFQRALTSTRRKPASRGVKNDTSSSASERRFRFDPVSHQ
jgi:hypothetical protein